MSTLSTTTYPEVVRPGAGSMMVTYPTQALLAPRQLDLPCVGMRSDGTGTVCPGTGLYEWTREHRITSRLGNCTRPHVGVGPEDLMRGLTADLLEELGHDASISVGLIGHELEASARRGYALWYAACRGVDPSQT